MCNNNFLFVLKKFSVQKYEVERTSKISTEKRKNGTYVYM